MNDLAPQHCSRLLKEMITVQCGETRQTATVIVDYEDEIASLYVTVEQSTSLNIPPLVQWDASSILDFVRDSDAVHNVIATDVGDDEDIFQRGCDS
ncbi:hypothetical protein DFH07DRAFT_279335 [Mycena maculata]|uniref:Uncharacterized protein n=1 Tax=Mycena maculata TaxID=230809 RepID=A0AAD7MLY8_9AGAR|nr:hypothetical protein DFH07DRAFT_279335 [Mycena maculata]